MSRLARPENYSQGLYGLPHMGEVIADHRVKAGWTSQDALSIVCGVDKQTVAYWEKQRYLADMDRRIFLSKLLKISPPLLGLTWRSMLNDDQTSQYIKDSEHRTELLEENSNSLYEDILSFAKTSPDKYSEEICYRFYKHQQELESIIPYATIFTQDTWIDLLSRYYQHSSFIEQHRCREEKSIYYANKAIELALSLEHKDTELLCSAYYKRARLYLMQEDFINARRDIQETLIKTEKARNSLRGSAYLLAAEVNAFYASQEGTLRSQCRQWQDDAANLLYKKKAESDTTFIVMFNLYAVHHERAKTLTRFALFHTTDDELIERLKDRYIRADAELLRDARNSLSIAKKHLEAVHKTSLMDYAITEARLLLVEREYEQSAKVAKKALIYAHASNSAKGVSEVGKIHTILSELAPKDPYVCNVGVELGRF